MSEKEILNVLQIKSGEYSCVMPLCIGALLAGANDEYIENLTKYGLSLGWAFQIQDDILGTFGNEKETGKPIDSDIREGKQTLLVLHLKKHGTQAQRSLLVNVLGKKTATKQEVENLRTAFNDDWRERV